jgi:hypothetical protein
MVGRIYPEIIKGGPKWRWFLQPEPAPPPNSGVTGSLEEAKAGFKRRFAEVKAGRDRYGERPPVVIAGIPRTTDDFFAPRKSAAPGHLMITNTVCIPGASQTKSRPRATGRLS